MIIFSVSPHKDLFEVKKDRGLTIVIDGKRADLGEMHLAFQGYHFNLI